ncbi:MAG: hypothetical protein U0105_04735 [Candidatus Obscuribacterales bacterium]
MSIFAKTLIVTLWISLAQAAHATDDWSTEKSSPDALSAPLPEEAASIYAKKYAKTFEKIFPYCDMGTELNKGHHSLLDCFASKSEPDSICCEQAIFVGKLADSGKSLPEIRAAVERDFSHLYPFGLTSSDLERYKKSLPVHCSPQSDRPQGDFAPDQTAERTASKY